MTISFDYDVSAFGALRLSPSEFARELPIAAAVQWYAQGRVSQGKAVELAALTRASYWTSYIDASSRPARSPLTN